MNTQLEIEVSDLRGKALRLIEAGKHAEADTVLEQLAKRVNSRDLDELRRANAADLDNNTPRTPIELQIGAHGRIDDGTNDSDYREQLHEYIVSGGRHVGKQLLDVNRDAERQDLSIGSNVAGGYLLPGDERSEILARMAAVSEIMGLVTRIQATQSPVRWPRVQARSSSSSIYTSAGVGSMVAEVPGATDGQNEQQFGLFNIDLKKARYLAKPSMDLVQDFPALLEFLVGDASENLGLLAESQIMAGTGIAAECTGMTNMDKAADGSQTENDLGTVDVEGTTTNTVSNTTSDPGSAPKILNLLYAVPAQYRRQPSFRLAMRSAIELATRQLVDVNGNYYWSGDGRFGGAPDSILGYRTAISEFVPDDGTDANVVYIAGDFSKILFAERDGIRVQVADQRYADTDQIGLFVRWRFGFGIANLDAFRLGIV